MDDQYGEIIKTCRQMRGMTLKELGEKTALSAGYLSMIERGLTTVKISTLQKIAAAFGLGLSEFFAIPLQEGGNVLRSHDRCSARRYVAGKQVYFDLRAYLGKNSVALAPYLLLLLPGMQREDAVPRPHEGEEFGYVLEGMVTLFYDGEEYELYPDDCFHFPSDKPHRVTNFSSRPARLLYVGIPQRDTLD